MQNEMNQEMKKHSVALNDRKMLIMTGIVQVNSFDEEFISLDTSLGGLTVEGKDLHVCRLATDVGEIAIEGKVDSLYYTDEKERRRGFFSRSGK